MFQLKETKVLIASVNARAEKHGDRTEPAFDLTCEASLPSTVLDMFDKELRGVLYKKNDQPDLVDQADPEALTALRFPKVDALKWDLDLTSYALRVAYGIGGPSDIQLADCKIDGFKFKAQQGGTVSVRFRVIAHPKTEDVGRLCEMIQNSIEMDITPPAPETVQELFGEQAAPAPAKKTSAQKKAEALDEAQAAFVASGAPKKVLAPAAAWPFPTDKNDTKAA